MRLKHLIGDEEDLLKISTELIGRLEKHKAFAIAAMDLESTPCSSNGMHPRTPGR